MGVLVQYCNKYHNELFISCFIIFLKENEFTSSAALMDQCSYVCFICFTCCRVGVMTI